MEAKWSYRFDRNDHLSGFTCIALDLEALHGGAAVGFVSRKGIAFAGTRKFLNILGYTVDTERLSEVADKIDTSRFYVNPSDKGKVLAAGGRWVTIPLHRMDNKLITVEIRTIEYEGIHRSELRLKE